MATDHELTQAQVNRLSELGKFFITVEGIEGVGKSTNMAFIRSWLEERGAAVVSTREPGGTPGAEAIRKLVLDTGRDEIPDTSELLLMFAARAAHLKNLIVPALESGSFVLCDRFTDASYAYQGCGHVISSLPFQIKLIFSVVLVIGFKDFISVVSSSLLIKLIKSVLGMICRDRPTFFCTV